MKLVILIASMLMLSGCTSDFYPYTSDYIYTPGYYCDGGIVRVPGGCIYPPVPSVPPIPWVNMVNPYLYRYW